MTGADDSPPDSHREPRRPSTAYRFGDFELRGDPPSLYRDGEPVPLQPQPTRALALLVARCGEVVSRDELRRCLWPEGTVVDHEQGINFAVRRVRSALGDDAAESRFVATVPRVGYRFVARVERFGGGPPGPGAGRRGTPPPDRDGGRAPGGSARPGAGARDRPGRRRALGRPLLALLLPLAVALGWLAWCERESGVGRTPGAGAAGAEPRLAVLPVEVTELALGRLLGAGEPGRPLTAPGPSPDPGDAATLSRVLTEELLAQVTVACAHAAGVWAIDSSLALDGATAGDGAPPELDFLVRGRLTPSEDTWTVTLRLVDAEGAHLWADSFLLDLGTLPFRLERAAGAIATRLDLPPSAPTTPSPSPDDAVYQAFLRGRFLTVHATRTGDGDAFGRGLALLERVAAAAPGFARGHAALAHAHLMRMGTAPLGEVTARAEAAARAALAVDPDLAEARSLLGTALLHGRLDWRGAAEELAAGVRLGPGISKTHQLLGAYLSAVGRHQEAVAELRRAVDLDPVSPRKLTDLALAYLFAGRWAAGEAEADRALEIAPAYLSAHLFLLHARLAGGDREGALQRTIRLDRSLGGPPPPDLDAWLDDYLAYLASDPARPRRVSRALLRALTGEREAALELLTAAVAERGDPLLPFVAEDPRLASLADDPRFTAVVAALGRPVKGDGADPAR